MARLIGSLMPDMMRGIILKQPTAAQRYDFAQIAHSHGHVTDSELRVYRTAAEREAILQEPAQ